VVHDPKGQPRGGDPEWPAHVTETRPWSQTTRSGTRDDRLVDHVAVSIPPSISELAVPVDAALAAELEVAVRAIVTLDNAHGASLEPLAALLLRTESVASSKIERIDASTADYARASYGMRSNPSATSMVNATQALAAMVETVDRTGTVDLPLMTEAHALLMADDPHEARDAGRLRTVQNWIGGSDHSPRAVLHVPPPPDRVPELMDDLIAFSNRNDAPAIAQAAIAHAQFESIHPFTDGNGRIGRALINAVLRRRDVTTRIVVPLASALVAHRDRYFDHLSAYRTGEVSPIISGFARASRVAAVESRRTAVRLAAIPDEWRSITGNVRAGSATARLLEMLPAHPALSSLEACDLVEGPTSSVYHAVERLHEAGVLRPLTDRKRDQVWGAGAILDELDDLGARIARAAR
jgi:Fic family protein